MSKSKALRRTQRTWLQLVRRWLRSDGRNKVDSWNLETGEYVRHYVSRYGDLVRETSEYLDPETFAREHISADVVPLRP